MYMYNLKNIIVVEISIIFSENARGYSVHVQLYNS